MIRTLRSLFRFVFGPFGRAAGVVFIVVAAWCYWWVWPERPTRTRSRLVHQTSMPFFEVWSPHGDWTIYMSMDQTLCDEAWRIDFARDEWSVIPTPDRTRGRHSVASPPDATWMAWVDSGYRVHVIALPQGREQFKTQALPSNAKSNPRLDVYASPDGAWLIAAPSGKDNVELWNVAAGMRQATLAVPGAEVATLAFTPGNQLLIGRFDRERTEVRVTAYSLPDGRSQGEILCDRAPVKDWHASLSPDGSRLFVTGGDRPRIWDMTTRPPAAVDWTWDHEPYIVQFSPDGRYMVTNEHNNHTWALRDAHSGAVIASEKSGWLVPCERSFVHDHPWYVACDRRVLDLPHWLRRWTTEIYRYVDNISIHMVLIDADTGIERRRVPGGRFGGWSGDGASFWTVTHPKDKETQQTRIDFNQWPLNPPGPPWWLYLLTMAVVLFIVYDFRRSHPSSSVEYRAP